MNRRNLLYPFLTLTISFATLAAPSTQPATAPTTKPHVLIKITGPAGAEKADLITMLLDITDAPDLKDWAESAANYAIKWHPEITKSLPSENFTPSHEVTLVFRQTRGAPAYTTGTQITISSAWVRAHPDDLGMVAHELTHVIQHYRSRNNPGWLVEGIADYIRYYVVEPGSRQGRFNPEKSDYKRGYQPAAGLLNWLEKRSPGLVVKLNAAMRQGKYTPDLFKELAGGDPDELWEKLKSAPKESPEKPSTPAPKN
jgi:hypothetical protein